MRVYVNKSTGEIAETKWQMVKISIYNMIHCKVPPFGWHKMLEEDL